LGIFLIMDLTHVHIPMGDGTFEFLYILQSFKKHVMNLDHPDYHSHCEFDVHPHIIEYSPWDFPILQEYFIDTLL
jgi:hypothetical protein